MAESPQFQQPPLNPHEAAHEEINAEIRNNRPRGANPNNNNNTNNNNANNNGNQQPVSILGHTSVTRHLHASLFLVESTNQYS